MCDRFGLGRWARGLAVLLAFVLVASACGGGDAGNESQTSQPKQTSEAAAASEPVDSAGVADDAPAGEASVGGEAQPDVVEQQELLVAPVDTTTTTTTPPDDGEAVADEPDEPEPRSGGTLRVAAFAEGDGLNPAANAFTGPVYLMAYPIFDPLAYYDTDGNWVPVLAESWTKIGDGTAWQMKLRQGVRFHDGDWCGNNCDNWRQLDADDVVATFQAQLADPLLSLAYAPGFDPDVPVRKVDGYTVEYLGVRPSARLPIAFTAQLGMVLPSQWLELAAADTSLNQVPVGTGPFMVERRVQDEVTVLVRNRDYWAADMIDIHLDRIEIYPITDSTIAAQRLVAGDLDLVVVASAEAILTLRDAADRGVRTFENARSEESMMIINAQSPTFSDIRARQALTFATDQELWMELLRQGTAPAADTMFHPDLIWRNPDVVQETNMPERAGPLVESYCADFPQNCSDGKINMRFGMPGPSVEGDRAVDLQVATWGEFFNLDTTQKPLDELLIDIVFGNYDVAFGVAFGSVDPDNDTLYMECGAISFISLNFARYCDTERDELIYEQRRSEDLDRRVEIWRRIQEINRDAYTYIFLAHSNWVIGARDNVHNICGQVGPTGDHLFCNNQGRIWLNQLRLS